MSIDATNWAWCQQGLSTSEKLLLLSLADRAGETHESWPSIGRLQLDTGISRKTLFKTLLTLQEKGLIIRSGKIRQVIVYQLVGVPTRHGVEHHKKLSTTRSKTTTSNPIVTSSKTTTGTSSKTTTGTSSKTTTQNHNRNPKRNHQEKPIIFCIKKHIKKRFKDLNLKPDSELESQVEFYAEKSKDKQTLEQSVNVATDLISKGKWRIPNNYNGITSQSIAKQEVEQQRQKEIKQTQDAKMARIIQRGILSNTGLATLNALLGKTCIAETTASEC